MTDGIIITISNEMISRNGYRWWLKNFFYGMSQDDVVYWIKSGSQPKREILYVYLCIGGKIRFRTNFVMSEPGSEKGPWGYGKAWIAFGGPAIRAPVQMAMKGFRGFRYTPKLF